VAWRARKHPRRQCVFCSFVNTVFLLFSSSLSVQTCCVPWIPDIFVYSWVVVVMCHFLRFFRFVAEGEGQARACERTMLCALHIIA